MGRTTYTHAFGERQTVRTARKEWECAGDGKAHHPNHASACPRVIHPGEDYLEYLGDAPAYQSGTRHSLACAVAFYGVTITDDPKETNRP